MFSKKACLGLGLMFAASGAYAQSYVMNFGTPLNGGAPATPVAVLTLTQDGNDIDFSLTKVSGVSGLGSSSFISELSLTYSGSALLGSFGNTGSQAIGGFKIDPSGKDAGYDFAIQVKFPTSNGKNSDRFVDGDVASWTLTNADVSSFLPPISGSGANAFGMVHVQGALEGDSFKYVVTWDGLISPVPEAQAWVSMLAGLGVLGLVFARRNKVGAQRSPLPSAA